MVARVHVGPFVAIDLHGNKLLIDQRRKGGIFVTFAVDDVAPVAPDRADIEQDGLIFGSGAGESLLAPLIPIHGLVCGRSQIRACGMRETVGLLSAQCVPH